MRNKITMSISISPEAKKQLKIKANESGMNLSEYVEFISLTQIVFIDKNLKTFTGLIESLLMKNSRPKHL